MCIRGGSREKKKKKEEEEREKKAAHFEWSQLLFIMLPAKTHTPHVHETKYRVSWTPKKDLQDTLMWFRRDRISSPQSEGKHHRNCLVVSSEYHTHKRSTDLKAHLTQWTHEGTHELPQSPCETACTWDTAWQTEVRAGPRQCSLSDAAAQSERGSEVNNSGLFRFDT